MQPVTREMAADASSACSEAATAELKCIGQLTCEELSQCASEPTRGCPACEAEDELVQQQCPDI